MDNIEDETSSPPNPHESTQQPLPSLSDPQPNNVVDNGDDAYDTEDTEDDDNLLDEIRSNGQTKGIVIVGDVNNDEDNDEIVGDVNDDDNDSDDEDNDDIPNGYNSRRIQDAGLDVEEQKKRKLKTLLSKYEFAPRAVVTTPSPVFKRSRGGRNSLTDWTEHESFVLLEAWGERYLRHNRKSVRSEEWQEVAEKVSEGSKIKRTETQCRNRLDTLKKKYKKEKAMLAENAGFSSNWLYFSKMDMIICSNLYLANGNGSMNSKVHESLDNSSDEMKDYLVGDSDFVKNECVPLKKKMRMGREDNFVADSDFVKNEGDNLDDIPPKKKRMDKDGGRGNPFKLLADSIDKFADMYEKIENYKSTQLVELEKMKMEFQRDLELEKRKILKRTQIEMAKIWGVDIEDNDLSPNNVSG